MRPEPPVSAEILARIREPLTAAGAEAVDVPLLQPLGLLLDLAGEAMRARLFVVQAEGGAEACLRPDFTVPVTRLHLDRGGGPGRYLYEGKAFRAAPAGSERPEEFLQVGVELFATEADTTAATDAEVAALAWRACAAGGRADLSLWLGDVALFAAFLEALDLAPPLRARLARAAGRPRLLQRELARTDANAPAPAGRLAELLQGLPAEDGAALLEEIWSLAGVEPVGGRTAADIAERLRRRAEAAAAPPLTADQAAAIADYLAVADAPEAAFVRIAELAGKPPALAAALDGWRRRLQDMVDAGVPAEALRFAAALGHAFDYYDGLTFEVRSATLGDDRPLAAGGRYDGLSALLGDAAGLKAVGCTVRPWRAWAEGAR